MKKIGTGLLDTVLATYVMLSMALYGVGKLMQFKGSLIETPINKASGMELMWAFYGYSTEFPIIIGILEITGGVLLFFQKTRLLGCLLLTFILVNILIQDIIYQVHSGAILSAAIYQTIVVYFMYKGRKTLKAAYLKLITLEPHVEYVKIFSLKNIVQVCIGFIITVIIKITLGL
ncbi:MAG: hypothetical protein KDC81_00450 [Flavobacteriaceae bacterium]|nr:hypothetical protein [Flavobacteriaceae bacterium]